MGFFSRIPLYARKALALLLNTGEFGRLSAEKTGMQNEQRQTINALASMQYELQKAYYEAERLKDELNAKEISLSQSISFLNELAARAEESETRFRLAGDGSNDGIWDWDLQKQKFYCAPSWLRIIGLPEDTILKPDELADLIHPDYLEPLWAAVRKALKSEELYFKHEMQVRHTNGHYVWVSLRARMARNEGGRVHRMAGTMTDTSQSKEYAARLQSSEHALLEAQKLAKIGSFNYNFVTKEFRYTSTYPMVYGCEDNEHFGKDAQFAIRFIHPDDLGHFKKVWDDALFENTELHVEYRVIKPSGEIGYVRCSGQPVFNEKNEQTGMVGTLQDITRERLMLEEALEARRIAEEATTAKTQFLSTMSHEIRTPMNAVIGFTRLLLLENPRPDQTEHLNTLRYSAEHLLSLINDILDYSKIDSGKVEFEQAPFSLSELLNDSLRMFRLRASET